jgi:hypothetical protein
MALSTRVFDTYEPLAAPNPAMAGSWPGFGSYVQVQTNPSRRVTAFQAIRSRERRKSGRIKSWRNSRTTPAATVDQ